MPAAVGEVAIPERPHVVHVADHAARDHLLGLLVERVAAVLRADLDDAVVVLGRLHDLRALLDRVGDRFLHVGVLARLDGGQGHRVVQVLGRRDDHGVDGRIGENLAVVHVRLGRVAAHGLDPLHAAGEVAAVGFADGRHLGEFRGAFVQPFHKVVAACAGPDEAHVDLVAGAECGLDGGCRRESRSGGGEHETSTRKVLRHKCNTPYSKSSNLPRFSIPNERAWSSRSLHGRRGPDGSARPHGESTTCAAWVSLRTSRRISALDLVHGRTGLCPARRAKSCIMREECRTPEVGESPLFCWSSRFSRHAGRDPGQGSRGRAAGG